MTLQDYLRVLREQWIVIVSAVIVAVVAGGVIAFIRPPEYTAKLTMYVAAQTGEDTTNSAAFQGAQLSQQRVTSYLELVSSTRVSREVIDRLSLTDTPQAVAKRITASSPPESVLIDVAVTGRSPEQVVAIANTTGDVFAALVADLEQPTVPNGMPPVAVRVVEPAAVPTAPSSIGLPVILVLGLLAGLAVGVGAALARNAQDTSVKSPDRLREVAQAPNLGTIAYDSQVPQRPLIVHEDPQSLRSEAFRQLRTNLQFVDVDHPRKVIVVTSSVRGEGKTTTVCNLAIAMAAAGTRVLVVEADLRRAGIADLLGVEQSVGLTSVLAGQVRVEQAIQPWAGGLFDVLASGALPPNPSELLASKYTQALLAELREQYDTVLMDSSPLLPVTDTAAIAPATDGAILVCRFRETSEAQVKAAVEALEAVSAPLLGTVYTMAPNSGPGASAPHHAYHHRTDLPIPSTGQNGSRSSMTAPTQQENGRHEPSRSHEQP